MVKKGKLTGQKGPLDHHTGPEQAQKYKNVQKKGLRTPKWPQTSSPVAHPEKVHYLRTGYKFSPDGHLGCSSLLVKILSISPLG